MLNTTSLHAVNHSKFSSRFVKPLYDSYCFSNIPRAIQYLLTGEGASGLPLDVFGNLPTRYDKVILFFVDAFGWRFFQHFADHLPFLKTALNRGVVSKLTSQFPSTTAAHATCIHTGLNVGQSGVYEWNYYEPLVDDIITPLLFSYARDKERDTLKQSGIAAAKFYPNQSLYSALKTKNVVSYVFQHHSYTPSTISNIMNKDAYVVPYSSTGAALTQLVEVILSHKSPPYYYFFYYDRIDSSCHHYGPNAPEFKQEVQSFFNLFEQLFYAKLAGKAQNTLLLITADHGQVEVDPATTFYLNKEAPGFERYLRTNNRGNYLVPAGSARDMFLHIKEEDIDEAIAHLQQLLAGRAEIYKTEELLAQSFFGAEQPSQQFLGRVGNVVILPYQNQTAWWHEEGVFSMRFRGHHGGLTPEEMEIPLLALPL